MYKIEKPLENRNGLLYIDGCNTLDLARQYDTPLYVYSENRIRENYRRAFSAFKNAYKKFRLFYAIKANNNLAILNILRQEGAGFDAACPEEIELALKAGAKPDEILYSGVYHRNEELEFALKKKVRINLEGISQINRLLKIGKPDFISFRINPGISGGSIKGLIFAGPDAKFGIEEEKALEAYRIAKEAGIKRFGMHMMTGSCVLDPEYFAAAASKLLDIAGRISKELGIEFEIIDIGGGLGVTYKPGERELNVELAAKKVAEVFKRKVKENGLGDPKLLIEPGRFIVCDAGILLTKVHSIKDAKKRFIGVDAGMNNLLRPMLYDAYHQIFVANKLNERETEKVNVVGPVCENTDQLAKDRLLPHIEEGDLLAVLNAGAYGFSMASRYNSRPMCAEVLCDNGKSEIIREREKFKDISGNVNIPKRLEK